MWQVPGSCPLRFPSFRLISLPSFWFCFVMLFGTLRLVNNWLVVSVLRLTGVLWSIPADGCPVLGPLTFSVLLWCGCSLKAGGWPRGSFSLWNMHTQTNTLLDIKMDPATEWTASLIFVFPEGNSCWKGCLRGVLKPTASPHFSLFLLFVWRHVLRHVKTQYALCEQEKKIIMNSFCCHCCCLVLVLNSHICSVFFFSSGGSQRLGQCDLLTCVLSFWSINC